MGLFDFDDTININFNGESMLFLLIVPHPTQLSFPHLLEQPAGVARHFISLMIRNEGRGGGFLPPFRLTSVPPIIYISARASKWAFEGMVKSLAVVAVPFALGIVKTKYDAV